MYKQDSNKWYKDLFLLEGYTLNPLTGCKQKIDIE